jgi:hypothetical protein
MLSAPAAFSFRKARTATALSAETLSTGGVDLTEPNEEGTKVIGAAADALEVVTKVDAVARVLVTTLLATRSSFAFEQTSPA